MRLKAPSDECLSAGGVKDFVTGTFLDFDRGHPARFTVDVQDENSGACLSLPTRLDGIIRVSYLPNVSANELAPVKLDRFRRETSLGREECDEHRENRERAHVA